MLILGTIIWYIIGISSFIYWWTTDYDLELNVSLILGLIIIGLVGPIAFLIGYSIHGKPNPKAIVLIKKRKE